MVIMIVAGLVVVLAGPAAAKWGFLYMPQTNCGVPRVGGEIMALSAALETYKQEHGSYPSNAATENLSPVHLHDPTYYIPAARFLYRVLSGDTDGNPRTPLPPGSKVYFPFKPEMVRMAPGGAFVVDPWGNPYGSSTLKARQPNSSDGHNNLGFDLWSTGGGTRAKDQRNWTKNW